MYYVDNASGISEMPALKQVYSTSPTWFTEGGGSTPPTYPGPDTYNMIIAEMINVLSAAGIEPKKDNLTQLSEAISKIVSGGIEGLGTAATHNVQTSPTDAAAGSVLMNGAWGLGSSGLAMKDSDILSPTSIGNAFFVQGGGTDNHYGSYGAGVHLSYGTGGGNTSRLSANLFVDPTGNISVEWLEINLSDGSVKNQKLQKLYGPLNKPTANDIGALPSGGTAGAATKLATARKIAGHAFDGTVDISISAADVGALPTSYSPDLSAYITTSSANSKFVQGVQLGAQVQTADGNFSLPAGCVVTSVGSVDWGVHSLYYKPIQRNINGSWVTISG